MPRTIHSVCVNSSRSIAVTIQNCPHVHINFFLTVADIIASQNMDLSFWIALYVLSLTIIYAGKGNTWTMLNLVYRLFFIKICLRMWLLLNFHYDCSSPYGIYCDKPLSRDHDNEILIALLCVIFYVLFEWYILNYLPWNFGQKNETSQDILSTRSVFKASKTQLQFRIVTTTLNWILCLSFRASYVNIYKKPTWCNLAVCLLVTAIILYMFRTLFASILRST